MSGIYYPESWMQHPEVLRLQQSNRDWHQMYIDLSKENEKLKKELHLAKCDLNQYIEKTELLNRKYNVSQKIVDILEQQMEKFNHLSPIRKMCHHFKLDKE